MIVRVTLTQEHINNGIAHTIDRCPIALACADALGMHVYCGLGNVEKNGRKIGEFGDDAIAAVAMFDQGRRSEMRPFSFDLTLT